MRAYCRIRPQPHYRRDAFVLGLRAAGYELGRDDAVPLKPGPEDLLVIWNKYGVDEQHAREFARAGARVIVAENGYIGRDDRGLQYYALALTGHNGSGDWHTGDGSRWERLGIALQPWQRNASGHILVCAQRGIGSREMASPAGWHDAVANRLRQHTKRPIRIRRHPEDRGAQHLPKVPLEQDLEGAYACVVWSSSSGVKALVRGIPVVYEAPHWICEVAACHDIAMIEKLDGWMNDDLRLRALREMAWAQWTVEEIAAGTPFQLLRGLRIQD